MGRPLWESGGRFAGTTSPASPLGRWVGLMVVGPSAGVTRGAAGFGATAGRLLTTRGASATGTGASASLTGAACDTAAGVAAAAGAATVSSAASDVADFAGRALVLLDSSGATSRRRPSLSALRRIRSAWASSMEAEGLDAPIPSVWASASSSLLVRPSSLESSCTRIFFCAKTFP